MRDITKLPELIHILNRLGHGLSYSLLLEAQTENAYQVLEQQIAVDCILPNDCTNETFTVFVADNIDRQEETLLGTLCL